MLALQGLLVLDCPVLQLQLWLCGCFQLLDWIGIRRICEEVTQPYTLSEHQPGHCKDKNTYRRVTSKPQ